MEHKALPIADFHVVDPDQGIVECIVSVTGIKDNVDDVIMPGAYEKTLQARTPKGVYSHDWDKPIAKTLSVRELLPGHKDLPPALNGKAWPAEAGALVVKAQFNLNTERGRDAYEDVKFYGDEANWSVGYNVPAGGAKTTNGVRYIKTMDLYEFSPVLFGAMPLAGTLSVKSAQQAWTAVKDVVGGQVGPTFDKPEGLGGRQVDGPFEVCPQHGDQPGEVRAKCMAMKACALKAGEQKTALITEEELTLTDALWADLADEPKMHTVGAMEVKGAVVTGAMYGGRFPIANPTDLANAIRAVGRAKGGAPGRAAVRRHIIARARKLKLTSHIPDTWNDDGTLKSGD